MGCDQFAAAPHLPPGGTAKVRATSTIVVGVAAVALTWPEQAGQIEEEPPWLPEPKTDRPWTCQMRRT